MTGKRQNDGSPMPAYMVGHTGYLFTTGFNNRDSICGEEHEITNLFALRNVAEPGDVPLYPFVSGDLPPLHSYD